MKNKLLHKYFLIGLIVLSLFSFAYVNLHAAYAVQSASKEQMKAQQPVLVEEDDEQSSDIPVPDVTILSRIAGVIQKLSFSNR